MKNIRIFYLKSFLFLVVKFSIYLNRRVFVMKNNKPPHDENNKMEVRPATQISLEIRKI